MSWKSVGLSAAVAACLGWLPATVVAAPISYQTAVLSDGPHTFYRLGEADGTAAADTSGNGNGGTYVGGPTLGMPGGGVGSDTAVEFSGTSQYVDSTATSFGSLMASSSFEFIFKTATPFPTNKISLAGAFNTGSTTAFQVNLNENAQGTTAAVPNSIRLFLRDEGNLGLGAAFIHDKLLDGNYHHLLFTYDSAAGASRVRGYVDGVEQTVTLGTGTGAGSTPTNFANFGFNPSFGARNVRGTIGQFLAGTIDEAAIYAKILTLADAEQHAAASGVPEPGAALLWCIGGVGLALAVRRW